MEIQKENPNSKYRGITWVDALGKKRAYLLGREITSDTNSKGKYIKSTIYSIDETSFVPDKTNTFVLKFTIKIITENDEVLNWYEIVNGQNITLLFNHVEYI